MKSLLLACALLVAAAPARAQLSGTCVRGQCADGYLGCRCDPACCERHMRAKMGGGGSRGSSGGGGSAYSPEMAAMGMMMGFLQGLQNMQNQQSQQALQQNQFAEEQRRAQELQNQLRAEAERAERQAAFEADLKRLSGDFKGDSPDLSKRPEMKMDEPVRRAKPKVDQDAQCRTSLPHAAHGASDTPEQWKAKQAKYLPQLAEWEKTCGSATAAALIGKATFGKVGALLAYDSRLARMLQKEKPTREDVWEINRLMEAGDALNRDMNVAERNQFNDLRLEFEASVAQVYEPVETGAPAGLLSGLDLKQPGAFPQLPDIKLADLNPGPAMAAGLEKLDSARAAFWKAAPKFDWNKEIIPKDKLPKLGAGAPAKPSDWKGFRHWAKKQWEGSDKNPNRVITELTTGGLQNEAEYSR